MWRSAVTSTVHPHVGGESGSSPSGHKQSGGSSPRGWGKPDDSSSRSPSDRFIPTWVGKARPPDGLAPHRPVHPHVGGESLGNGYSRRRWRGSSPRGWGKPRRRSVPSVRPRFIPTWVGKADGKAKVLIPAAVHPHVGGESLSTPSSSRSFARFIPTWVGKARTLPHRSSPPPVHPHVGGESGGNHPSQSPPCGSSPRGWGKPTRIQPASGIHRFIPTWVGKASRGPPGVWSQAVHPHVGGESSARLGARGGSYGSSPRGWGKREDIDPH